MIECLPEICHEILSKGIATLNLTVGTQQQSDLLDYIALLNQWNNVFNLTAIRQPEIMITRHLLDSLSVAEHLEGEDIIDVGTGAGIPGIPLAIVFPERRFTLMDSKGKKIRFIEQVKQRLVIDNIFPVQHRMESYQPKQKFDAVISRAFTSLEKTVKTCEHLVKNEGLIQAMKGAHPEQKDLPKHWKIETIIKLIVPGLNEQRHLINMRQNNKEV